MKSFSKAQCHQYWMSEHTTAQWLKSLTDPSLLTRVSFCVYYLIKNRNGINSVINENLIKLFRLAFRLTCTHLHTHPITYHLISQKFCIVLSYSGNQLHFLSHVFNKCDIGWFSSHTRIIFIGFCRHVPSMWKQINKLDSNISLD